MGGAGCLLSMRTNRLGMALPLEWYVSMSKLFKKAYIKCMQLSRSSYSLRKVPAANRTTL